VLFTLVVFSCVYLCPTHIVLCFCFVFLRLVYHMIPVSLDCQFVIAPSVFSNVYYVSFSRSGSLYIILSCKTVAEIVPIDGTFQHLSN
jgi:hypothetical protein